MPTSERGGSTSNKCVVISEQKSAGKGTCLHINEDLHPVDSDSEDSGLVDLDLSLVNRNSSENDLNWPKYKGCELLRTISIGKTLFTLFFYFFHLYFHKLDIYHYSKQIKQLSTECSQIWHSATWMLYTKHGKIWLMWHCTGQQPIWITDWSLTVAVLGELNGCPGVCWSMLNLGSNGKTFNS